VWGGVSRGTIIIVVGRVVVLIIVTSTSTTSSSVSSISIEHPMSAMCGAVREIILRYRHFIMYYILYIYIAI